MTSLLLGLVLAAGPSDSTGAARRATDELFRAIPAEVGAVAVLEDLDGFITRIEQAEIVKRLRRSSVLGGAVEREVVRYWKELDSKFQSRIGVGLETLRKDVFGLSVVLAYWPKAGGPKDETGLLLVRARSAERLDELLHTLFRIQGGEPPKRTHAGVPYWTSRDGERQQFLLTLGPIGMLTDDEEAVQRVIQTAKGGKSWESEAAFGVMRSVTPKGALLSVFLLPRKFDVKLPMQSSGKPGEAMVQEAIAGVWKSLEWVSFTAQVESSLQFGLHASVDASKLPPQLGQRPALGESPIPTQGLKGTIASFAAGADVAALSQFIGRLIAESNPKDAAAGGRFVRSLFMGADRASELVKSVGPRLGAAVIDMPDGLPASVVALELRPAASPGGLASNADLVEQALRFAALALTLEANKNGDDRWELRTESMNGARVHIAAGGKNLPKGVEPCFSIHKGWILAASNPSALRQALTEPHPEVTTGEFGRLDLQAAQKVVARFANLTASANPQGAAFLDAVADAVPLLLLKENVAGGAHHWTLELPAPK